MAAPMVTICISLSYRLVPVFRVLCHACAWRHSVKGLICLALGSLFGWTWFREHLDLELETSPRHLPDCWFTWHTLVNLSVDPLANRSWWLYANLSYYSYGEPLAWVTRGTRVPISARGRSTKQSSRPPFRHVEWSPPIKKSIKVMRDTSYPTPLWMHRLPTGHWQLTCQSTRFHLQQLWHLLVSLGGRRYWTSWR